MAAQPVKPILQKPPGYRDPTLPIHNAPKPQPRKPVIPPSFQPKKRRKSCCRIFCCCCCVSILILIFLISMSFLVLYLWFDPKLPVFHLQSFSFRQFNISEKPDGTYLDVQTLTRVEVRNPNGKLKYHYGKSVVEISTSGDEEEIDLGSAKVAGFTQAKKNVTRLKIETESEELVEQGIGTRLRRQFRNKDLVVKVVVRSSVGLGVGRWKIKPVGVNVICGDFSLKRLDSAMPRCTINTLKWINLH